MIEVEHTEQQNMTKTSDITMECFKLHGVALASSCILRLTIVCGSAESIRKCLYRYLCGRRRVVYVKNVQRFHCPEEHFYPTSKRNL